MVSEWPVLHDVPGHLRHDAARGRPVADDGQDRDVQQHRDAELLHGDGYSATNEVTGTGYTASGQVIPVVDESPAGTYMHDLADQVWASPTTVTAYGAKLYSTHWPVII